MQLYSSKQTRFDVNPRHLDLSRHWLEPNPILNHFFSVFLPRQRTSFSVTIFIPWQQLDQWRANASRCILYL